MIITIQENACYYPLLGNAGHSFSSAWLKRAYQRAKDEAEEEGKSLADIVAKRYGVSLFFGQFTGFQAQILSKSQFSDVVLVHRTKLVESCQQKPAWEFGDQSIYKQLIRCRPKFCKYPFSWH